MPVRPRRLGVHGRTWSWAPTGGRVLRDAMTHTLASAETIGVRAMLFHAIDQDIAAFYLRHGLQASPTDPRHLMILIEDIAVSLNAASLDR
jgi:hypothetical protein